MMEPSHVAELAASLIRGTAGLRAGLAEAGFDPGHVPAIERALASAEAAPGDPVRATALAVALLDEALRTPRLMTGLGRLTDRPPPARDPGHTNTISGSVLLTGPSLQARDVSGGVHFHPVTPPPVLPVPRQLLPVPGHFIERHRDSEVLDDLRSAQLVVVSGLAGVGKTAFVTNWLHRLRDEFPDGQLYADLRGHAPGSPSGPGEVLGQFLRAYGLGSGPADLAEQAALWRSAAGGRCVAVMLDNAVSAAQVRPLLLGTPGSLVVVVSRRRLTGLSFDGARFHELGPLEPDAAVELLAGRIGPCRVRREHAAARTVAKLCGGLPLAVCLAGARMAARPRQSVASMVEVLSGDEGRLAALRADGQWAVRAALDESYDALPPDTARGYRCLGIQPVTVFGTDSAAAACGLPPEEAEALLDELVEVNLIEDLGDDRFRFHDLVRLHAGQRARDEGPAESLRDSRRRLADWYLRIATEAEALLTPSHRTLRRDYADEAGHPPRFPDGAAALDWLAREQAQLAAVLRDAVQHGWDATAWQIADAMWPAVHRLRLHDLWIEIHEVGLAAARRAGHPEGVSRMLTSGGGGLLNAGRADDALGRFTEALADARRDGDVRAEAQALHGIGQAHQLAGRLDRAWSSFTRALELRERIGYRRGVALSRVCLGDIALAEGRPDEAVDLLTAAHAELVAVQDRHDAARAQVFLGRAHAGRGDLPAARSLLLDALDEFRSVGSTPWTGRTLEMLGRTEQEGGDLSAARAGYEASLAVYLSISPRDTRRLRERIRTLDEFPEPD